MQRDVSVFRTNREKIYGAIMVVVGVLIWVAVIYAIVQYWNDEKRGVTVHLYVGYGVAFFLFVLVAAAAYRASAFGNMILLGPEQFPELHAMVGEAALALGLEKAPKTFLYNSQGVFNAFARRLRGGNYVFLTSALVDANSDEQIRFVIGHELGHHAAGHLNPWMNFLRLPAHLVPFLGKAYSRSREYTCDSVGAYIARDFQASRSALQMLGCGCRRLNHAMDCDAFMAQEQMVPPVFGFLTEIFRSHPRLTRRVAAIRCSDEAQAGVFRFGEPSHAPRTGYLQ